MTTSNLSHIYKRAEAAVRLYVCWLWLGSRHGGTVEHLVYVTVLYIAWAHGISIQIRRKLDAMVRLQFV